MVATHGNGNGNGTVKLLAFLGGVVAIAGPMTMGILAANERARIAELKADAVSASLAEYRASVEARHATVALTSTSNTTLIKDLDDKLQREMRLLDAATDARVDGADRRLQDELHGESDRLRDRIAKLELQLESLVPTVIAIKAVQEHKP